MKLFLVLGSVLLISVIGARAATSDDGESLQAAPEAVDTTAEADSKPQPPPTQAAPEVVDTAAAADPKPQPPPTQAAPEAVDTAAEADPKTQPPPTAVRKVETLDKISRNSSAENIETKTKDKVKVKVRYDRHGNRIETIKDTRKTKTKKDEVSDDYKQVNHTLTEGGIEDSCSLTQDKQHELKEVNVQKKTDVERIVTDKYGNVISDTRKTKEKDRTKTKETDKETSSYVHTVKQAPSPVPDNATEAPEC